MPEHLCKKSPSDEEWGFKNCWYVYFRITKHLICHMGRGSESSYKIQGKQPQLVSFTHALHLSCCRPMVNGTLRWSAARMHLLWKENMQLLLSWWDSFIWTEASCMMQCWQRCSQLSPAAFQAEKHSSSSKSNIASIRCADKNCEGQSAWASLTGVVPPPLRSSVWIYRTTI